jgi:hypothetical protein
VKLCNKPPALHVVPRWQEALSTCLGGIWLAYERLHEALVTQPILYKNWCILLLMDYVPLALEQVGCEPQSDPIVPELEGIMISSIKREDAV